jgi:methionyl aminopeptidase|uniref:Methionine aminopeptidase n=1 Tax=candidate division WOR-3 bacterium TaxID=2052148 RepID=A0A7C4U7R9_UNCW3
MIIIKNDEEIKLIREASRITAQTIEYLGRFIKEGITTKELDRIAEEFIRSQNAIPAFKGYRGYPASICASVNDVVIHGIPNSRRLKEGDIISIDIGVNYKGYFGDAAYTFPVGEISENAKKLMDVTKEALYIGIKNAIIGKRTGDVGCAIEEYVEGFGFSVVRDFCGHGVGKMLHEEPAIPNFGERGFGYPFKKNMTVAIEPMVNEGISNVRILDDGWTVVTFDGSLSAHFEHTILITEDGNEILTKI